MGEVNELSKEAQRIYEWFRDAENRFQAVWSKEDITYRSGFTPYRIEKILPELVDGGYLVTVNEDRCNKGDLLYGVNGARTRATYYMLPERLKKLEAARLARLKPPYSREALARLKAPYFKKAQEIILERYADEVMTEFEKLWENREEK